jgi:hypothetical protein
MVAGVGMKLMVLTQSAPGILGLTGGKFSHSGWCWNEPDGVDLLLAFLA